MATIAALLHAAGWLFPGIWYAVWLGQAATISLGAVCRPRAAFFYGIFLGTLAIGCSFYWGASMLQHTFDTLPWVAWSAFVLLVAGEAVAFGLFCLAVSLAFHRTSPAYWLIPCAWVAIEFWWPRVFPWKLAYSQLEVLPLLQIAELFGPGGIGFVMTAAAAIPVALWVGFHARPKAITRRRATIYSVLTAGLLVATLLYGQVRIWQWSSWLRTQPKLKIGLIQVDPTLAGAEASLRERSLAIHDQVDLICWPESSLGTYCERLTHFRDRGQTQLLSRDSREALGITQDLHCFLLAGAKSYVDESDFDCPYDVVAFLVSPEQDIVGRYQKQTLLPLGEYIPGERLFPMLRQWADLNQNLQTGDNPAPLTMGAGKRLGVLICYEDTLVSSARKTVERDADVLFCLINAAAFENPLTLKQHLRLAALRAIENRRYFARCASTGITCIIDPMGKVVSQLPVEQEGTLTADVCLVQPRTVFNRLGDVFSLVCTTIITLAALAYCTVNRRG